ncbi:unnamed protein product [Owenia fusiformis]|uniref:L-Fucosyltransferase n=1 Tax=Owenia fusiformis TaxID=6347 RepID=A0A8S4NQ99_OWEFU|nr:unnamed protein product [Owenia fusiformis]
MTRPVVNIRADIRKYEKMAKHCIFIFFVGFSVSLFVLNFGWFYTSEYGSYTISNSKEYTLKYGSGCPLIKQFAGRTGNQMFMFASAFAIAKKNKMTLHVSTKFPLRRIFRLKWIEYRPTDILNKMVVNNVSDNGESATFHLDLMTINMCNTQLSGYLQSWRYFSTYTSEIKAQFQFQASIANQAQDYIKEVMKIHNAFITVGVHVRRYKLDRPGAKTKGYRTPPVEYYHNAIDHFTNLYHNLNIAFIICTDDYYWVAQNLNRSDVTLCNTHNPAALDLAILSQCNASIMSIGSFGWWAAYLSEGPVVYYGGNPIPGSDNDQSMVRGDYFLPHWTSMLE